MRAVIICSILFIVGCAVQAAVLFQDTFTAGAGGWTGTGKATVSPVARRTGMKSLVISQVQDTDADSAWLSPTITGTGKPIKLSFWAVGNYQRCTDFSYSGCMDVVEYDNAGKATGGSMYLVYLPWDDARKEDMWGMLLPTGFVWKYYECIYTPHGNFRIKFHWPKPMARGNCYLTDVQVAEATPDDLAATAAKPANATIAKAPEMPLALEISTPVTGNLFYAEDPLQFDALVYTKDRKALSLPADAKLVYTITDFQHRAVLTGEMPFTGAKPVTDPAFLRKFPTRQANAQLTLRLSAAAAKAIGQEFFLATTLVSGGKTLAADTVPYGVVSPRPIAPEAYPRCHFTSFYFANSESPQARRDAISEKSGLSWAEWYDYGWKNVQPHYPGPFKFTTKAPAFPRVIYCPNLEQLRGRPDDHPWGAIATMAPAEAQLPDPFHPGVKTFQIDPYVEYMVANIRQNREAIALVVPSGLERPIDARTIELQKKAYTAIKKAFPDLPVGMMLYGLTMNPSWDVDLLMKEKLYDYCDFIDTHIYASAVDWSEWGRLQRAYQALGRKAPPLISTEFSRVGGMDQVQRSRDMIGAHLDAFAHGMENLLYFNCTSGTPTPFLREPTDLGSDQGSGFMYLQNVNRPRVAVPLGAESTTPPALREETSTMPILQTMTYYNLVQNFEAAAWRKTLTPDANSIAYIFDRSDRAVAALWLTNPVGTLTVAIKTSAGFRVQDLYGHAEQIQPHDGIALLALEQNPQTLIFDRRVDDLQITPLGGGLQVDALARGTDGSATLRLPAVWKNSVKCRATFAVDGNWPAINEVKFTTRTQQESLQNVRLRCPLSQPVGAYTLTGRLYAGTDCIGMLRTNFQVEELLKVTVDGVPPTVTTPPALKVTLQNLQRTAAKGEVLFPDHLFAGGFTPELRRQPYTIPAHGTTTVLFPLEKSLVSLATAYDVSVNVRDVSGIDLVKPETIAFRACERAPGKITVDGDLSDWHLEQRTPIPFERAYGPSKTPDDLSGVFYSMWDDDNVYFAAVVKDNSIVSRSMDISLWMDDNIMFGFYPWGWKQGENLHSGYYREHLGLCSDGAARILRVGNVDGGPATANDARIAVKRTVDGLIYEWAYPKAILFPLALKAGNRFRISMFLLDVDKRPDGTYTDQGGIQLGGFNTNVDARPVKWREFVMTE